MSDDLVVFAVPVEPGFLPIRGSTEHQAKCGHAVWLSPESRKLLAGSESAELWCIPCGSEHIDDDDIEITERQIRELARELSERQARG